MLRAASAAGRGALVVPPALHKGDLVGVAATGSAVDRAAVEAGARVLEAMGLRIRFGRSVFAREGGFAGSDAARARDLIAMLEDDEVRAVHFARGGWGTSRILRTIPWRTLALRPKLLIGYSDLTSLFAPALDRARLSCVYGPMVAELGRQGSFDRSSLERAYFRPREPFTASLGASNVWIPGSATGRAAGGCLTVVAHLAGTPYAPSLRGRVLLLEEVAEPPYRIDRLLIQMSLAGMLDGVAGVLVGSLTDCRPAANSARRASARATIVSALRHLGIPVVGGPRFGHIDRKLSVPLGFRVRIDTRARRVVFSP